MITIALREVRASRELEELILSINDSRVNIQVMEAMLVAAVSNEKGSDVTEFLSSRGGQMARAVTLAASGISTERDLRYPY